MARRSIAKAKNASARASSSPRSMSTEQLRAELVRTLTAEIADLEAAISEARQEIRKRRSAIARAVASTPLEDRFRTPDGRGGGNPIVPGQTLNGLILRTLLEVDQPMRVSDIRAMAMEVGFSPASLPTALNQLRVAGDVVAPKTGSWRLTMAGKRRLARCLTGRTQNPK